MFSRAKVLLYFIFIFIQKSKCVSNCTVTRHGYLADLSSIKEETNFKCISERINVCSERICDQRCNHFLGRAVCSCDGGYEISVDNFQRPYCSDIDECLNNNGGCEHICENAAGSYRCLCNQGFQLSPNAHNCHISDSKQTSLYDEILAIKENLMVKNDQINTLQNQVIALTAALELNDYRKLSINTDKTSSDDNPIDTYVKVLNDDTGERQFCKCKRGPIGPPGATGSTGPTGMPGPPGAPGPIARRDSLDFVLLALADARHDLVALQKRVFAGQRIPRFDLRLALRRQRMKEKQKLKQNKNQQTDSGIEDSNSAAFNDDTQFLIMNTKNMKLENELNELLSQERTEDYFSI